MTGTHFNTTHGMSNHRLYHIHKTMIARCHNPKARSYEKYGGAGITVCDEWRKDRVAFFKWALSNGYAEDLTIDRIDGAKGYSPDNCRWISRKAQANNRRSNHVVEVNGECHTLAEWSEINNISKRVIHSRLHKGWNEVKAVTTPTMPMGSWRKKEKTE